MRRLVRNGAAQSICAATLFDLQARLAGQHFPRGAVLVKIGFHFGGRGEGQHGGTVTFEASGKRPCLIKGAALCTVITTMSM